ncbi:MAG TPA: hypothetical protein VEK79_04735 [Thermoanaerobaculia bacterium]|nr:hypothetical protein [Thermoanaerobaculia bacterium]
MRTFLLTLYVLTSSTAAAQPVVMPEHVTAPHTTGLLQPMTAAPPVAMAVDKHGVAMAWTAQRRIHVARLDASGRIDGGVHELPIRSSNVAVEAHQPSLAPAPSNDGFVIGWIEFGRTRPLGVYTFLDANLAAALPSFVPSNEVSSSILVRTGSKVWIAADRDVYEVDSDRFARLSFSRTWPASGLALVDDYPTVVSRVLSTFSCTCSTGGGVFGICPESCKNFFTLFQLQLDQPFASVAQRSFRIETRADAALGAEGDELLIAWFMGRQADGGTVVLAALPSSESGSFPTALDTPVTLGKFRSDAGPTRPDIAANGKRRVVVWRNKSDRGDYDVVGASIDEKGAITRFDIATSDADERNPSVLALPNGNFLVAYEKTGSVQRSIAWRFVLFEGRRRAVR